MNPRNVEPPKLVLVLLIAVLSTIVLTPWPGVPWLLRICGIVVAALGLLITIPAARRFDDLGTNIKPFDDPGILVQTGTFRWTRNPMYLGFLLLLCGAALFVGSAVGAFGPIVFFFAADLWYIPFEEDRMSATFGDDYASYQRRVRRWIGINLRRPPSA